MRMYGLLAAAAAAIFAIPVMAADAPEIVLRETGVQRAYQVTLENWDSAACAAQFDLTLDGAGECVMEWADSASTSFYKLMQEPHGGNVTLTFYCDKRTPLSGVSTAALGTLKLPETAKEPSFSTSGRMKVLDGSLTPTVYDGVQARVASYTPPPVSSGSGIVSGGSGGGGGGSRTGGSGSSTPLLNKVDASWKEVRENAPPAQQAGGTVTLNMTADTRLSAEVLAGIRADGVKAILSFGSYEWVIDGAAMGEIPADRDYYDLSIKSVNLENLSAMAGGASIVQFETGDSGPLPFKATLRWPLGAEYAGKTVWLGRYDPVTGRLEPCGSAVVNNEGTVEFAFDHFSYYVIASADLWGAAGGAETLAVPALHEVIQAQAETAALDEPIPEAVPEQPEARQPEAAAPAAPAEAQPNAGEGQPAGFVILFAALLCAAAALAVGAVLRRRRGGKAR